MFNSSTPTAPDLSRRAFLQFLGRGLAAAGAVSVFPSLLSSCTRVPITGGGTRLNALKPTIADDLTLPDGLSYRVIAAWEDTLGAGLRFGFNNDYIAFQPLDGKADEGYLWVNHEYIHQGLIHRFQADGDPKARFQRERTEVGGSVLHIRRGTDGWELVPGSTAHKRVDGTTEIPFAWPEPILGSTAAIGTLGNCAGGYTPWGTFLTCEENYDSFYGERRSDGTIEPSEYGWETHDPRPPEHYGWVVEVNPATGAARKLVALGRCAHECATVFTLPDGRQVVYTGDDAYDQYIYKFVSARPGDLTEGTLYVANTQTGTWLPIVFADNPLLQQHFKSQTEVLIRLREAATLLSATPQDRPEDIEIDPATGHVFVSCTMNPQKGNPHGHILKIDERGDHAGTTFTAEIFLAGGPETGFACPDNLAFDPRGGLWFTSDIPGSSIEKGPYTGLGNNGLFYVPMQGEYAGEVIQLAAAPVDAELTGPFFLDGGRTLLLSVQHPGETSQGLGALTSHWPGGGDSYPRPALVAISGPLLTEVAAV